MSTLRRMRRHARRHLGREIPSEAAQRIYLLKLSGCIDDSTAAAIAHRVHSGASIDDAIIECTPRDANNRPIIADPTRVDAIMAHLDENDPEFMREVDAVAHRLMAAAG